MNVSRALRCLQPVPSSLFATIRDEGGRPWLQMLHVMWSLWVLSEAIFGEVDASFWINLALSYPLFLLLFWLIHVRPQQEALWYRAGFLAVTFASLPWNSGAWSYAVFACAYASVGRHKVWKIVAEIVVAALVLVMVLWWGGLPWPWLLFVLGVCFSGGFGALAGFLSQRRQAEMRLSIDEVRSLAASAERERIGRDLHDLLGHTLSLITLKLELSRKLLDRDPEATRVQLQETEDIARKALAEVRSAVTGIRATDLAAELASAHLMLESSGVRMRVDTSWPDLPEKLATALALVVREAATNIARHSGATQADFVVELADGMACLLITDNGRGGVVANGHGLAGMHERIEALHGYLELDSPRGKGTRLRACIPVPSVWSGAVQPNACSSPIFPDAVEESGVLGARG